LIFFNIYTSNLDHRMSPPTEWQCVTFLFITPDGRMAWSLERNRRLWTDIRS